MALTAVNHAIIASLPLMRGLEPADQAALIARAHAVSVPAGQMVFEKGDKDESLYIVISGRVEISVTAANGRRIALNIIAKGDCFGEIGLLGGGARTASAVTMEACRFMIVNRRGFLAAVEERPKLAMAMIGVLCERLRWVSTFLEDQTFLPLVQRLARRLLFLHGRFADEQGGLHISQADIADFSGATREAVNKILTGWRQQGWISLGRSTIAVRNQAALSELAALGE